MNEPRVRTAFYHYLKDTVVATDMKQEPIPSYLIVVVVVYLWSISNVMVTRDIEALLYSKVHAVLEY